MSANPGIPKSIGKGVNGFLLLAHGTFFGAVCHIVRNIRRSEQGIDRNPHNAVGSAEHCADSAYGSAVIAEGMYGFRHRLSRGGAGQKEEHVLILDHGQIVVPEHHLSRRGVLRRNDIDGLVGVSGINSCMISGKCVRMNLTASS